MPGEKKLPQGQLLRDLTSPEQEFVPSERILCRVDFSYYLTRYHTIERDPGVGTESGDGPGETPGIREAAHETARGAGAGFV